MTTLYQTSTLFKKYAWVLGIISLIIFFTIIILFQLTAKKSQPQTTPIQKPNLGSTNIQNSGYSFEKLNLPQNYPKELPVYTKAQNISLLDSANTIAQKLNFKTSPKELNDKNLGKGLLYSDNTQALSIYNANISYQKFPSAQSSNTNDLSSLDNLKQAALSFIANLGLASSISPDVKTTYYKTQEEFLIKVDNPQDAQFVSLDFNFQINGIDLLTNSKPPASITFNRQGQITGLIYNQLAVQEPQNNYSIISPQEATQEINKGSVSLINLLLPNTYDLQPSKLGRTDLLQAKLAYFYPKDQQIIQPVWVFYGQTNSNGNKIDVVYAVPAISSKLFISSSPVPKP